MGYRIRYGMEAKRVRRGRVLVTVSVVLLTALLAAKWLGGGDRTVLTATAELVRAVSAGEGWYWSLARFCGRIINGTA